MYKYSSGRRAAKMPPAVKQGAVPAYSGKISKQAQSHRYRLLSRIEAECDTVERILALDSEQYERLSAATKMAHRIRLSLVADLKQERAELDAAEANNHGGAR